jgi:para-nitrobenzyl esterase
MAVHERSSSLTLSAERTVRGPRPLNPHIILSALAVFAGLGLLGACAATAADAHGEVLASEGSAEGAADWNVPIQTDSGKLTGARLASPDDAVVRVYKGIPYAAPPVGALRWKEPQPVASWTGVREATSYGKMCPQPFPASPVSDSVPESGMSEDCLTLNVVTGAKTPDAKLPVMVWFHGGGLTTGWGNSESANAAPLAGKGVVQVSVTHRLGPIGYLAHPALTAESPNEASGNYGSLDTVAALRWVQKNIAAFGGDPANVTIWGVSGGGQKTLWLMASPLAKGLFHRSIVMSGGVSGTPLSQTEELGKKLAARLGAAEQPDPLAALRAKSWQEIIAAGAAPDSGYQAVFSIDGWSMTGVEAQSDLPFIVGFMGAEKAPDRSPGFIARAITPATQRLTSRYAYVFTHLPYGWGSAGVLAYHGGDVAYAFGVPYEIKDHYGTLFRPAPGANVPADPGLDERDDWVAQATMEMFTQFARTGDPNLPAETAARLGKSWRWPKLDASDQYLDIGVQPIVKTGWVNVGVDQQKPRY